MSTFYHHGSHHRSTGTCSVLEICQEILRVDRHAVYGLIGSNNTN